MRQVCHFSKEKSDTFIIFAGNCIVQSIRLQRTTLEQLLDLEANWSGQGLECRHFRIVLVPFILKKRLQRSCSCILQTRNTASVLKARNLDLLNAPILLEVAIGLSSKPVCRKNARTLILGISKLSSEKMYNVG